MYGCEAHVGRFSPDVCNELWKTVGHEDDTLVCMYNYFYRCLSVFGINLTEKPKFYVSAIVNQGMAWGLVIKPEEKGESFGMLMNLSEGQSNPQEKQPNIVATGVPLPPDDASVLLNLLPVLPDSSSAQVEFNLPAESLAAPRPGIIIQEPFPPLQGYSTPSVSKAVDLKVLRFSPEGAVDEVPFISITFNQPVVALETPEAMDHASVPVYIEPALPGAWRWLGTKTITFEYDSAQIDRFLKSTEYRVTVPAGTASVGGNVLKKAVSWIFKTPTPKIINSYPSNTRQPLQPLFFIAFDQRIDPVSVLHTVKVTANKKTAELALATEAEIRADVHVSELVRYALEGCWLAFRATKAFPVEALISVVIGPGTPSAEGPLLTTEAQSFQFKTYAPLQASANYSSRRDGTYQPLSPLIVRFNNLLDFASFDESMVSVTPDIPGLMTNAYNDRIEIKGQTRGCTNYTVTLSGHIKDVFGQELGKDVDLVFNVGSVSPALVGIDSNFITLDPSSAGAVYSIYAVNYKKLDIKIYSVKPSDWPAYKNYRTIRRHTKKPENLPGVLVADYILKPDLPADVLTQVNIELKEYLNDKFGQFVVVVAPSRSLHETKDERINRLSKALICWVQVTQIGLDAYKDHSTMLAWASSLKDGAPLEGVSITPSTGGAVFQTAKDGTVSFPIPSGAVYLQAQYGEDVALLPRSLSVWDDDDTWNKKLLADSLNWYIFDDRAMYRPGEEVHVKGWIRKNGALQTGNVCLMEASEYSLSYIITDAQAMIIAQGFTAVNELGGFDFAFIIDLNASLGNARIDMNVLGGAPDMLNTETHHTFEIQEFRRPEFEVKARNESGGPYFVDGQALFAVQASYYSGGPLTDADATWEVDGTPTNYTPPHWPDFTFGAWEPWWVYCHDELDEDDYDEESDNEQSYTGKTDPTGTHYLQVNFSPEGDPAIPPAPQLVKAEATVMDVNRQAWTDTAIVLVHPASLYIGLRSERYFVEKNTPLKIEYVVTDLEGNAIADSLVEMTAARLEWRTHSGEWQEEAVDFQTCLQKSTTQPGLCIFETAIGGKYQITAVVTDPSGRKNQTSFTRWVSGGRVRPSHKVEHENLTLIPDKQIYQPGDTAHILVQTPFSPAEGLLTVSRSGMLYTTRFLIESNSITLDVPVKKEHIPNLEIQVNLVGSAVRLAYDGVTTLTGQPERPAYASGTLSLDIPPLLHGLQLQVAPDESSLSPGGETMLTVALKSASGFSVAGAELAVVVVDEAILSLTSYTMENPLDTFYSKRDSYFSGLYGRASILLAESPATVEYDHSEKMYNNIIYSPMRAGSYMEAPWESSPKVVAGQEALLLRSKFNPLALFVSQVRTGLDGTARILVKLPDNLTRYRVMVVAVGPEGQSFGMGESSITARLPLMVRPSAPRFLNFGDQIDLPIVLQNQTNLPMEVRLAARAINLELKVAGLMVQVPANDRVEVRMLACTSMAGTARVQVVAVSGNYSDAAVFTLPVNTPCTTEAFATYGVLDEGTSVQTIGHQQDVFPQYGGLKVTTSSTALQSLSDAVLYLVNYPYECSEQIASRILAVSALKDVLTAFKAEGLPSPRKMEFRVRNDIERLYGMQNYNGGFATWHKGFESNPFNTIHVAHALERAAQKGYFISASMRKNALTYIQKIEAYYPTWYRQNICWTLSAYALYVRNLMGDCDTDKAENLIQTAGLKNLPMQAIGWLWPVVKSDKWLDQIRKYVNNHVVETAGAANFITEYDEQAYLLLSSDRRTDATLLHAMMADTPNSDLIVKLVNGLLNHRTKGRWANTQENVFVLLALDAYFNTYEAITPDFVAQFWLGDTYAGRHEFRGRTTDYHETLIPMNYMLAETAAESHNLVLSKEGPGRLYYRLGMHYAPINLNLQQMNKGFFIQRTYEGVDKKDDVTRDENGRWHIKAGSRVRVNISMVTDNRRYHVAMVDSLPAGLEIINPALSVSGSIPENSFSRENKYAWRWGAWFEHQNLRDNRTEAFASLLWEGIYQYGYVARATTPGVFVVPPARAEEMYSPEVFGRSSSDWVIIN